MVRFRERGRRFLIDFLDVYRNVIRRGRFRFLLTLLLTAVQWICRYSFITALLACFQVPLQPVRFFLYQWFVFSIMTFTPTPGAGVGAEAGFVMVYGGVIPGDIIGLATAGWRILTFYLQLSLGMIVFSLLRMKSPGEGGCARPRDKILKTAASS